MNWKKAYLETRILSASPVELINILYEYAAMSVQDARECLAKRDVAGRAQAISKAIAIIGELESSLDHQQGGEIAGNLGKLYRYMRDRLTHANLRQEDQPLAEVEALLKTLGEGWKEISGTTAMPAGVSTNHFGAATESWTGNTMPAWSAPPMMDPVAGYASQSWSA